MADIQKLDAHEQPSALLRSQWKAYARATPAAIDGLPVDEIDSGVFESAGTLRGDDVRRVFGEFLRGDGDADGDGNGDGDGDAGNPTDAPTDLSGIPDAGIPMYFHPLLPGLIVVPKLLPPHLQTRLLDRLVHRDLSQPRHQTNLHLHYHLPYPPAGASFFAYAPDDPAATFRPRDPSVHRPLSARQVLDRRLHWVTLGGQYDWTRRVYDEEEDSLIEFPPDVARLVHGLFPATRAEAAIVNFYTPGDTMMMHRDVSEATDKGLVSLSLGCDALFMAAPTAEFESVSVAKTDRPYICLRLRSGDAIYMTGHARFAWHGVPKVLRGTCPDFLADWPAGDGGDGDDRYEAWRGWMRNKRINLNVRQMKD